MDFEIGIVCATCDGFNAFGAVACVLCKTRLHDESDHEALSDGLTSGSIPPPTVAEPGLLDIPAPPSPQPRSEPLAARSSGPPPSDRTIPQTTAPQVAGIPLPVDLPGAAPRIDSGSAALFSEALRLRRSTPGNMMAPKLDRVQSSPLITTASSSPLTSPSSSSGAPPIVPSAVPATSASTSGMSATHTVPAPAIRGSMSALNAVHIPRPDPGARPVTAARAPQSVFPPGLDSKSGGKSASQEELMEQAKNFICRSCSTPVPVGHKFCGRCGAAVPPDVLAARTQFFGQLQAPGKAKLILIRGEGVEGLSYQLNAEQHIVGRNGQLVFPDDPFVSPKHANLFYRNQKLVVRDEGSLNGVFLRVRGTIEVLPNDHFLAGEQLFRLDATPKFNDGPAPDGTYFYSSPKHQTPFRVAQILQGGAPGMVVCARTAGIQIGREGGDMNFPGDLYMSASHCKIDEAGGKLSLTDLNSRNGTYVRLKGERELAHGDYLFIGKKLLRVEITAA
jgi:pSer/pThr/pTyr-binding forkhead associated (FHA) protein